MVHITRLKKVPSGCPGQVDFSAGQVTFHSHLPDGRGARQVGCQVNNKESKLSLAQVKQTSRAAYLKGKLEFRCFFKPCIIQRYLCKSPFFTEKWDDKKLYQITTRMYHLLTNFNS